MYSFFNKYKPKKFNDFVIDKNIINTIKMLLEIDTLNILLIGDGGSGKSSLLQSIMYEYYKTDKLPTDDILYINNLAEQGVQYYRNELKTFCQISSNCKKKKTIILDDIDRIPYPSQQVFRNYIDKYSNNVNFLISCTNIQKVIDNVQSRCILLKIKPINIKSLKTIFYKIKKNENINIDEQVETFILGICDNSMRLLINYMQKFKMLETKITLEIAEKICTNINFKDLYRYTKEWKENKDIKKAYKILFFFVEKGFSVIDILENYFLFIKTCTSVLEEEKYKIIKIILNYIRIFHTIHEENVELIFFTNDLMQL
ncbi:AAA family ATPase [bacterium]|nr:AAA family ATPase [bacterium]